MRREGRAGAIKYVLATYSEFSLVALLTLFFTNTISQQVLADSSIAFIVISYSTFLALGFHNGAIRDGAISNSVEEKEDVLRLELYFSAFVACVLLTAAMIAHQNFYLMAGLFIGAVNHLKTACQTVFRLLGRDTLLNTLNVTWASVFFVSFSLLAWLSQHVALEVRFFGAWGASAAFVISLFFVFCMITLKAFRYPMMASKGLFLKVLNSSKYMFLMASGLVVLLTSDRVVLTILGAAEKVRADFQYVDVLTNIYFLGMTSVLYYFTPGLLKRFSGADAVRDGAFAAMMLKYVAYLLSVVIFFAFAIMVFLLVVHRFSWELVGILLSMLTLKTVLIVLGFVCNFYLAQRLEKVLAAAYLGLMVVGLSLSFVYGHLFVNSETIVLLPLINALLVGALVVFLLKRITTQGAHEKSTCIN
ncbi:hypothetical protein AB1462_25405 [Pseudomonas sp. SB113]|uniref:hypothetical protein n=1 Tax=Pseudomonas sp. SB113 TaxID=3154123 RepID=UPI00345D63D1